MPTQGYVVVLRNEEAGVTQFPNAPDSGALADLMRAQIQLSGREVADPPKYFAGAGSVVSFSHDRQNAIVFATQEEARAAIDRIPAMVRPAGLSVQPVND
jgi:hypothetical protein